LPHPTEGYHAADGIKIPSVTTITGRFKESGGLIGWAWNQGYAQGKAGKPLDRNKEKKEAGGIGTYAHGLAEAHLKHLPAPPVPDKFTPEMERKAIAAYEAYLNWEEQTRLEIISLEEPMTYECHRYGGTPDGLAILSGKRSLLDFKTSNSVYTDFLYQIAAYGHLEEVNHPWEPLDGGFHLIKFGKEHGDFAHHYFGDLTEAFEGFLLMRRMYDIDLALQKRVK
jgi:hypothetical protein